MGTDKRERQKAGRYERAAAELAAARKQRSRRTAVRLVVGVVVVLALLFGWSLLQGDDDDETATDEDVTDTTVPEVTTTVPEYSNPELAEEVLARGAPDTEPPPEDTPADALESTTLTPGEGEGVAAGDSIMAMYVGKTPDGNVFDESWEEGVPIGPIVIGQGQVIPGWDEGLLGAKIGERRHLVIGADNGYGEQGQDPIPPNSPLSFDVDIVDIQPAAAGSEASEGSTPDVTANTDPSATTTPAG